VGFSCCKTKLAMKGGGELRQILGQSIEILETILPLTFFLFSSFSCLKQV
jgi:hypothetical protein